MREWPEMVRPTYERAIFLDRDGTISEDSHYPHRVEDLNFLPGALGVMKHAAALPVHIIVVTNQAGIALRRFTVQEMVQYNQVLRERLQEAGGRIDAFYYCPHKEPKELEAGERGCECAKPRPGMLFEAAKDFNLSLRQSFLIGDKQSDILAGQAAGCRTWLVKTGKAGSDMEAGTASPHSTVADLAAALAEISLELAGVSESRSSVGLP